MNSLRRLDGRRRALELIAAPPRPARPPHIPARRLPRRPGERREPLLLPHLPSSLASAAADRGLELGCAVELCLERAVVLEDLTELGIVSLFPRLLALCEVARVRRALPPAKARYLQVLLGARERRLECAGRGGAGSVTVDVPMRLFPRVLDAVPSAELSAIALAQALELEIAAVSEGRTMIEWTALAALTLTQ